MGEGIMSGDLMIEELDDLERFIAWFLYRCNRGEIKSRWTRAVAQNLVDKYEISIDDFNFDNDNFEEFKPKGMFYNE